MGGKARFRGRSSGAPGSRSVHRGHSSSPEHLPVTTWTQGYGRWHAAACWGPGEGLATCLSHFGRSVMLVKLHCLLRAFSGGDQMTHCPRQGLVALLTARPFPPSSCNPCLGLPKHMFPFCHRFPGPCFWFSLAGASSAALRCPQKHSRREPGPPRTFQRCSCLSPLLPQASSLPVSKMCQDLEQSPVLFLNRDIFCFCFSHNSPRHLI